VSSLAPVSLPRGRKQEVKIAMISNSDVRTIFVYSREDTPLSVRS